MANDSWWHVPETWTSFPATFSFNTEISGGKGRPLAGDHYRNSDWQNITFSCNRESLSAILGSLYPFISKAVFSLSVHREQKLMKLVVKSSVPWLNMPFCPMKYWERQNSTSGKHLYIFDNDVWEQSVWMTILQTTWSHLSFSDNSYVQYINNVEGVDWNPNIQ